MKESPVLPEQEFYSYEKLDEIINGKVKEEEGRIIVSPQSKDYKKPTSIYLRAETKLGPDLISGVHGKVWNEEWKKRGEAQGMQYYTPGVNSGNTGYFSREINVVDYSAVMSFVQEAISVISKYNEASRKYNEQIAQPHITEIRKTLDSIL